MEKMEEECSGTGVITRMSNDFCVVSLTIEDTPKSFLFSKVIFYSLGLKCEGDMTNILEEGMEVNVSYKIPLPGLKPSIVAVWLGEKPKIIEENQLKAIYDRKGRISYVNREIFMVEDVTGLSISVNKEVVFRNGQSLMDKNVTAVSIGEDITFDAIQQQGSFIATCAWLGPNKPGLSVRFSQQSSVEESSYEEPDLELVSQSGLHGIVVVIPNDVVAIVEAEHESLVLQVMVFRDSFNTVCESIQEVVNVGDSLCLWIEYSYIFPGRKQWFAVKAMKVSEEVSVVDIDSEEAVVSGENSVTETMDGDESFTRCDDSAAGTTRHALVSCYINKQTESGIDTETKGSSLAHIDPSQLKEDAMKLNAGPDNVDLADVEEDWNDVTETNLANIACQNEGILGETDDGKRVGNVNKGDEAMESVGSTSGGVDVKEANSSDSVKKLMRFNEKSNVLYSEPPLRGTIARHSFDGGVITFGDTLKISVGREDLYIDGSLSTADQYLECVSSGNHAVYFEAEIFPDTKTNVFTHRAIMAWVGEKPSLAVVAKSLPSPNLDLLIEGQVFFGEATKYYLPQHALVVIPGAAGTVCVDIGSFSSPEPLHKFHGVRNRTLITNYVKLREKVSLKLEESPSLPGFLLGWDAHVTRCSHKVWNNIKGRAEDACRKTDDPPIPAPEEPVDNSGNRENEEKNELAVTDVGLKPFGKVHRERDRTVMLNFSGTVNLTGTKVIVEHVLGNSPVDNSALDEYCSSTVDMLNLNDSVVCFDAKTDMFSKTDDFYIERMWGSDSVRPPTEILLKTHLNCPDSATFLPRTYLGKISSIPTHDCAIAQVKNVPVLLPLESLVTSEEFTRYNCTIDVFFNVGDDVVVNIEKCSFPGSESGKYCRAINCWAVSKTKTDVGYESPSWFDVWGFGEYYRKERVLKRNNGYFVEFSSKRPNLKLTLDLFEKNNVYVDNIPITADDFEDYEGKEIVFHVAHEHPDTLTEFSNDGMYVACAWIGKEPCPEIVLKKRLAVPKGLVCTNWMYESVVKDFVLPEHVICAVGVAPVLVPLSAIKEDGKFIGVVEDVKKGDRIFIRVQEKNFGDCCQLFSNAAPIKPVNIPFQKVLRNVTGRVVEYPNPVGRIKAVNASVEVSFELCHVRASKIGLNSKYVSERWRMEWFESLKEKITVGMEVRFSAIAVKGKTAPYRALEVFF